MKQFIYFFSGLLLLFISTTRVVAQEVSDYSQLSEEDYRVLRQIWWYFFYCE